MNLHPNIVAIIDCFETRGRLHIVMEYCDAGDLVRGASALVTFSCVLCALQADHARFCQSVSCQSLLTFCFNHSLFFSLFLSFPQSQRIKKQQRLRTRQQAMAERLSPRGGGGSGGGGDGVGSRSGGVGVVGSSVRGKPTYDGAWFPENVVISWLAQLSMALCVLASVLNR
jgi:hypothetical protein